MPERIDRNGETVFACSVCGLLYPDEQIANRCEAWCTEHKSCNIEIIKAAVGSKGEMTNV